MTAEGGAGRRMEPTSQGMRDEFATLPPEAQARVRALSARLYDGTRTVSACWKQALAAERLEMSMAVNSRPSWG